MATALNKMLTHSEMACAKTCLRKHYWCYELGLRPDKDAHYLRFGTAFHVGRDALAQGLETDAACDEVRKAYQKQAPELQLECETVCALIIGYDARWNGEPVKHVASEFAFDLPMNALTGGKPRWRVGGKIDGIVEFGGGLAVLECKTTGENIEPDSDYWRRLAIDQQISLYMLAAIASGHAVKSVLYDVIRKPSIRQKQNETAQEYIDRLMADTQGRPAFYYARREIPRLEADLAEFVQELRDMGLILSHCRRKNLWPRNTNACLMMGKCPYLDLCIYSYKPDESGVPAGFVRLEDVHPELQEQGD